MSCSHSHDPSQGCVTEEFRPCRFGSLLDSTLVAERGLHQGSMLGLSTLAGIAIREAEMAGRMPVVAVTVIPVSILGLDQGTVLMDLLSCCR